MCRFLCVFFFPVIMHTQLQNNIFFFVAKMLFYVWCVLLLGCYCKANESLNEMLNATDFPLYTIGQNGHVTKKDLEGVLKFSFDDTPSNICNEELNVKLKFKFHLNCTQWVPRQKEAELELYHQKLNLEMKRYPICHRDKSSIAWAVVHSNCVGARHLEYLTADPRMDLFFLTFTDTNCTNANAKLPKELADRFHFVGFDISQGGSWAENRNILYRAIMHKENLRECLYPYHVYVDFDISPNVKSEYNSSDGVNPVVRMHDLVLNLQPLYATCDHSPFHQSMNERVDLINYCDTNSKASPTKTIATCMSSITEMDGNLAILSPRGRQFLLPYETRLERHDVWRSQTIIQKLFGILFLNAGIRMCDYSCFSGEKNLHSYYPKGKGGTAKIAGTIQTALIHRRLQMLGRKCTLSDKFPGKGMHSTWNGLGVALNCSTLGPHMQKHVSRPFEHFNAVGTYGKCTQLPNLTTV